MKKIKCPQCGYVMTFDEKSFTPGQVLTFNCNKCNHQFRVRLAKKEPVKTEEPDLSLGGIIVIENIFGFKQVFPLVMGDNVIGRKNKDTEGVNIAIKTSDPSMSRNHCVINVSLDKEQHLIYTLRDFPSITGTFLGNVILGDKERVIIADGAVITIGATTIILQAGNE